MTAGDGVLIVNYHYCQPRTNGVLSGMAGPSPEMLSKQLSALGGICRALRLKDLDGIEATGTGVERPVLVTFDDGTKDVFEHALPLLRQAQIPAVLFCCSQPLVERRVLDVQKMHMLQVRMGRDGFRAAFLQLLMESGGAAEREDSARLGLAPMYRYDDEETRKFKFLLNVELPYRQLTPILDRLFEDAFGDQREAVKHIYMSLDDLKRAQDWGFDIALHTHAHRMLSRLDENEQRREMGIPQDLFREALGAPGTAMSYPYGIAGSWNAITQRAAVDLGITRCFTLGRTHYCPSDGANPLEIPRYDVNDVFDGSGRLRIAA